MSAATTGKSTKISINAGKPLFSVCRDTEDLDKIFSLNVAAELSFILGSASAFVNFSRELQLSSTSVAVVYRSAVEAYEEQWNPAGLSDDGAKVARDAPDAFLLSCGESFISSISYGYEISLCLHMESRVRGLTSRLTTGFDFETLFGDSLKVRSTSFEELKSENLSFSLYVDYRGLSGPARLSVPADGGAWSQLVSDWLEVLQRADQAKAHALAAAPVATPLDDVKLPLAPLFVATQDYSTLADVATSPQLFKLMMNRRETFDDAIALGASLSEVRRRVTRLREALHAPTDFVVSATTGGIQSRIRELDNFVRVARNALQKAVAGTGDAEALRRLSVKLPPPDATEVLAPARLRLDVRAHVKGEHSPRTASEGEYCGSDRGSQVPLLGVAIRCTTLEAPLTVRYAILSPILGTSELEGHDWGLAGSTGRSDVLIKQFRIWLEGPMAGFYGVRYRGHFEIDGESEWTYDGKWCSKNERYLCGLTVEPYVKADR